MDTETLATLTRVHSSFETLVSRSHSCIARNHQHETCIQTKKQKHGQKFLQQLHETNLLLVKLARHASCTSGSASLSLSSDSRETYVLYADVDALLLQYIHVKSNNVSIYNTER